MSGKLLGLALLTVLPLRERGNNYRCREGSECRGDRWRPGDGYLRGNQYGFTLAYPIRLPKAFKSKDRFFFTSNFETLRNRSTLLALKLFQYHPLPKYLGVLGAPGGADAQELRS